MSRSEVVRRLLNVAGTTYATEAGIRLRNEPMPLFQLLTLAMLSSKPIGADVAAKAAHAMFRAGIRTPAAVLSAERRVVIDAFGRAGYARYDESSATGLAEMATAVRERYRGDLRNLAVASKESRADALVALQRFKGIGPIGSSIFLREVQDVWPWAQPFFDDRAIAAAGELGLPTTVDELADLAPRRTARLAAALTRVSLHPDLRDRVMGVAEHSR